MKKILLLSVFVFATKFCFSQTVYKISIVPVTVGSFNQYVGNVINVMPRPIQLGDTQITVDCYLIDSVANGTIAIPDMWGMFTVALSFPFNSSRSSLRTTWENAILNTRNPAFVKR